MGNAGMFGLVALATLVASIPPFLLLMWWVGRPSAVLLVALVAVPVALFIAVSLVVAGRNGPADTSV
jgi:hypothetical protein